MISRNSINGAFPIKRLGEVVEFLDSQRRPVTESDRRTGPYPYYGANGQQGMIDDYIFDEPLVLLAEDGGHFGDPERAIAYRISGKTWVNNHAHVLRPKSDLDLAYLCRVLENYDVTPFVTGTTRGKLTKAGASEITIPLPPLAEQRRIAEILDRAEALRAKRRAVFAELDFLARSLFFDLFGDPVTNPKGWTIRTLDELGDGRGAIVDGPFGSAINVKEDYIEDGEIPVIRTKNVRPFEFITDDLKRISRAKFAALQRSAVVPGDIILTKVGTIGNVCLFPPTLEIGVLSTTGSCRIRPNEAIVRRTYLAYYLHLYRSEMLKLVAKGVQPFLNMSHIKSFRVPVPSLDRQDEFVRRVAAVEKLKSAQRASLTELDALFGTLQHRAFRGEL